MKVYKVELMILDFDGLSEDDIKEVIENQKYPNHCINPEVTKIEAREIGWSDEHPLNNTATSEQEFKRLFQ